MKKTVKTSEDIDSCCVCGSVSQGVVVVRKCEHCDVTKYCSKECQTKHFPYHTKYCSAIVTLKKIESDKLFSKFSSVREQQIDEKSQMKGRLLERFIGCQQLSQ